MLPNVNYKEAKSEIITSFLSKQEQIVEYLKKYNKISRVNVEEMFGVSKTRDSNILNDMISQGLITKVGKSRNIIYILK